MGTKVNLLGKNLFSTPNLLWPKVISIFFSKLCNSGSANTGKKFSIAFIKYLSREKTENSLYGTD